MKTDHALPAGSRAVYICPMDSTTRSPVTRRYAVLFGLVFAGIAGYWLWWQHVASTIEKNLTEFAAAEAAAGRQISWSSLSREGFPYRMEIRISGLQVDRGAGRVSWPTPGGVVLHFMPFNLSHMILHSEGPVTISEENQTPMVLTAELARASVILAKGAAERIAVDMAKIGVEGGQLPNPMQLARLQLHARKLNDGASLASEWAFKAEDMTVALTPAPMGGEPVKRLEFIWVTPGGFSDRPAPGQTIRLSKADLAWGLLTVSATGTLGLDAAGKPAVKLDIETEGETAIVDDAVTRFNLPAAQGEKIKAAMSVYKALSNRNGKLLVTVVVENNRLNIGGIDLGPIPALPVPKP